MPGEGGGGGWCGYLISIAYLFFILYLWLFRSELVGHFLPLFTSSPRDWVMVRCGRVGYNGKVGRSVDSW